MTPNNGGTFTEVNPRSAASRGRMPVAGTAAIRAIVRELSITFRTAASLNWPNTCHAGSPQSTPFSYPNSTWEPVRDKWGTSRASPHRLACSAFSLVPVITRIRRRQVARYVGGRGSAAQHVGLPRCQQLEPFRVGHQGRQRRGVAVEGWEIGGHRPNPSGTTGAVSAGRRSPSPPRRPTRNAIRCRRSRAFRSTTRRFCSGSSGRHRRMSSYPSTPELRTTFHCPSKHPGQVQP